MKYLFAFIMLISLGACKLPPSEKYIIILQPSSTDPQQIQAATAILSKRLETAYEGNAIARVKGSQIEIELHEKVKLNEILPLMLTKGRFTLQETIPDTEIIQRILKIDPGAKQFGFLRVDPSRQSGMIGETSVYDTAAVMQSPSYVALKNQFDDMDMMWGKGTMQGNVELFAVKKAGNPLSNGAVESVVVDFDAMGREAVSIVLKNEYHEVWLNMTRANISKSIAICLDNHVLSAPRVNSEIPGGRLMISGGQEGDSRMLAAIIGSDVLPISLSIASVDPALEKSMTLSYPTAAQIERYKSLQQGFLTYRHQIDSIVAMGPTDANTTMVRREFGRIYHQDLPTIVDETKLTEEQVDMFLEKVDLVLTSFKVRIDPEGNAEILLDSLSVE